MAPRPGSGKAEEGSCDKGVGRNKKSLPIQQPSQELENMGPPNSERKEITGCDLGGLATHATATTLSFMASIDLSCPEIGVYNSLKPLRQRGQKDGEGR